MGAPELKMTLEPPQSADEKESRIALLNEVLEKREQEVSQAKMQYANLQARMTSEKVQWTQKQAEEEQKLQVLAQQLEAKYKQRMSEADQYVRQAQLDAEQIAQQKSEAEQATVRVLDKETALGDLNKERVEVATLSHQAQTLMHEAQEQMAQGKALAFQGQDALVKAERMVLEAQARLLTINDRQADIEKREEQVRLTEKQQTLVRAELDRRLEDSKLVAPEGVVA